MTRADRRLAALAACLVPDACVAALGRLGGPGGAAVVALAERLARAPEPERLAALGGALPGPIPVEEPPPCAVLARLRLERLAAEPAPPAGTAGRRST